MKTQKLFVQIFAIVILLQAISLAQFAPRQDAVWARTVPAGTITMDGVLNEAAWSQAESFEINYGQNGPLPTSGWRAEFQQDAVTDPTHATVKFLVSSDNQLWLGFNIPDSSVGGNADWARWDGILSSIRSLGDNNMAYAAELFYTYWTAGRETPDVIVDGGPYFVSGNTNNRFATWGVNDRTPEQIANWDAATVILGGHSNDAGRDEGWVVEMRINLSALGYDVTQTTGDVIPYNFSIWDCDYLFEGDPSKISTTRTHLQSPWGNANANNAMRIYARPDIGLGSTLPEIAPDVIIPNGAAFADPVIDGNPNEAVWDGAYTFDLGWDIANLRQNYPGIGKIMSANFQPEIGGNPVPPVLDPSLATIKMFFKDHYLYLAANIMDGRVQGSEVYDQIDGLRLIIGDRLQMNDDNNMIFKQFRINFNGSGAPTAYEYLATLVDSGKAEYGVALTGATTVNVNTDIDEGYSLEMKIDLTVLGYPADLGDKLIFTGVMLADGDSFDDPLANYGTRTWWFREHDGGPVTTWSVLDPNTPVGVDDQKNTVIPNSIELYGNFPNPFNPSTTIKFAIPETGDVNIKIYNTVGEEIRNINLVNKNAGELNYTFNAANISSGVYFYKISLDNSATGKSYLSNVGKMILLK
ncbi:MAG: T9SS type A sorting domain-containing protein [Ignavibacterium sp.]|nr:T9SS type A sorting domain-containing protein [Ignavibacterium sp.]